MRPATLPRVLTAAASVVLVTGLLGAPSAQSAPAHALAASTGATTAVAANVLAKAKSDPNPVTPGDFSGYGFDQCLTPSQATMNRWLRHSPFMAVGIYISGDSRACRSQPNLTPTWVRRQLASGWRLLPITLGPQASCQPRFPRYSDDFKIDPRAGRDGKYRQARAEGQTNGKQSVADAATLGIVRGSTLWYDLEGFDNGNTSCRESALAFLSGWVRMVKKAGYVSGVYSSASSGIAALDRARIANRKDINFPDRIWLARWDGAATTSTSYIKEDGWRPGGRVKQFQGGHDETWGGVRINIDSNRLQVGRATPAAESHCGRTAISFSRYPALVQPGNGNGNATPAVQALKCLLTERGFYNGKINAYYTPALRRAVDSWHQKAGLPASNRWTGRDWMGVLTIGYRPIVKFGVTGPYVRRIQRGLNAAKIGGTVPVNGVYNDATVSLVRRYQARVGLPQDAIVGKGFWNKMRVGAR